MRFDFHSRKTRVETRQTSESFTKRMLALLVAGAGGILLLLYLTLTLLGASSDTKPTAYLFVRETATEIPSEVRLVWITERKKELMSVSIPPNLGFSSPTIGTYPIAGAMRAYGQQHVSETTQKTELSLFFRTRIEGIIRTKNGGLTRALFSTCSIASWKQCLVALHIALPGAFSFRELEFPATLLGAPDAAGIARINRSAYADFLQRQSFPLFGFEGKTIALVNASGVNGIGKRAQAVFEDLGLSVLVVTDTAQIQEHGSLVISQETPETQELTQSLATFFSVKIRSDDEEVNHYRTELVFFIGKKQAALFTP